MIYSLLSLNRSFLLVMKSEIIFRNFFYIWLRFLSLSIYFRCLQFESELNSNDLFFWISFQSNLCRFAVRAISILADSHFIFASRQISTMTSDSESLVNRSEKRRIIITNRKNEDLKKEHLMRKIITCKRHNLKDSDLWKQFREEFDDWDETKFFIVGSKILKKFRAFLRIHDV
jgi:hypothetical protein